MSKNKKMANLGLIIALVGGLMVPIGVYMFNKYSGKSRAENHKEVVEAQSKISEKVDSSEENLKKEIEKQSIPTKTTVINKETHNTVNAPNAVIVTQNQTGGKNTVNYFQNEFRPPDAAVLKLVEQKLDFLVKKYPNHPFVQIEIESGNSYRHKVALTVAKLFQPRGIGAFGEGNTSIGRFPDYPISVFVNQSNHEFVQDLIASIKPLIEGEYKLIEEERWSTDFIRIYLNGQPSFDNNGKVKIN